MSDIETLITIYCAEPRCVTNLAIPKMSNEDTKARLELNDWWPGFGNDLSKYVCPNHRQIIEGD